MYKLGEIFEKGCAIFLLFFMISAVPLMYICARTECRMRAESLGCSYEWGIFSGCTLKRIDEIVEIEGGK